MRASRPANYQLALVSRTMYDFLRRRTGRRIQIALNAGLMSEVQQHAWDCHQFGQPVAEGVAVEEVQCARDLVTLSFRPRPARRHIPTR